MGVILLTRAEKLKIKFVGAKVKKSSLFVMDMHLAIQTEALA